MIRLMFFLVFVMTELTFSPAHADENVAEAVIEKAIEGGFSELEKQIIEKYFGNVKSDSENTEHKKDKKGKSKDMPKGLAKKDELPPGLAKQLEKNGSLPPGLAKRDLPKDLQRELPDPIEGLERTIVENSVVLVEKATGRIVDILKDVVTGN